MENGSDFNQYMISFKYQFKSYIRTKRFLGLFIFTLIISVGITALILHDEYSMLKAGTALFYFHIYPSICLLAYNSIAIIPHIAIYAINTPIPCITVGLNVYPTNEETLAAAPPGPPKPAGPTTFAAG